jgi:hypothetical protein
LTSNSVWVKEKTTAVVGGQLGPFWLEIDVRSGRPDEGASSVEGGKLELIQENVAQDEREASSPRQRWMLGDRERMGVGR